MAQFLYNLHGQLTQNRQFGYKENLYYNTVNDIVGGNSRYYNGNISSILWSYGAVDYDGPQVGNGYHYSYDSYNRLSYAQAIMYRSLRTDLTHFELFEYDLNGNVQYLQRDYMDDIEIRYDGNHLQYADDYGDTRNQNGRKEFHGTIGAAPTAYAYDANGNLTKDLNRGISNIRYNIQNLPAEITFTNGNKIRHYYDAYGVRYHTATITNQATATLTASKMAADAPLASGSAYQTHQYFIGNCVYWQTPTGQIILNKVLNPMGYISLTEDDLTYNYYAKDYLGNVKEVYSIAGANATTASCIQRMQYYPSGLPWENNFGADEQPYKYGGKEFVEMHSLDEYDSEARWYYPALMCTTTMDPLCEKYYSTSPYAWCGNNPVNIIDPDGRNPIYDLEGNFLGVDEYGYDGEIYVMDSKLFVPGMEHVYSEAWNVGINFVDQKSLERILSNVNSWIDKPDSDGKLTLEEANNWYRVGNGEPLCIPITSLDLSNFRSLGEAYVGKTYCYNLLIHGSLNDGLVLGNITFKRHSNHQVRAFPDTYDFDIKESFNPLTWLRNMETRIGKKVAGEGQAYQIQIYGSQTLTPLFPWIK